MEIIFDIETEGLDKFEDRVTAIGIKTKDFEKIFMNLDEKKLLQDFWDFIRIQNNPKLIGFNSQEFDLPFLVARSLALRVSIVDLRYKNLDLRKLLGYGSFSKKGTLNDYAKLVGLSKLEGLTGADAVKLWKENKLEVLKAYLLEDLRMTFSLLERLKQIGVEV